MEKQVDCIGFDHETGKIGPLAKNRSNDCQNKTGKSTGEQEEEERQEERVKRKKKKNKWIQLTSSTTYKATFQETSYSLFNSFIHSHWQFSRK